MLTVTWKRKVFGFQPGEVFEFPPGLTLLVGEQGSGKSMLLNQIYETTQPQLAGLPDKPTLRVKVVRLTGDAKTRLVYFDFEHNNPRTRGHIETAWEFASLGRSHGEVVYKIIENIPADAGVVALDEPDVALSPRSTKFLAKTLKTLAAGRYVLAAVHSPIVMLEVGEVYSMEHRKRMSALEFLSSHLGSDSLPLSELCNLEKQRPCAKK